MPAALVQSKTRTLQPATSGSPTSVTVTMNAPTTPGNLIVLTALYQNANGSTVTVGTPSGLGASWSSLVGPYPNLAGTFKAYGRSWLGTVGGAGGTTVTLALTLGGLVTADSMTVIVSEFSGVSTAVAQPDATGTATGTIPGGSPGAPAAVSVTVATTHNTDLIYSTVLAQGQHLASGISSPSAQIADARTQLFSAATADRDTHVVAGWRSTTLTGNYGAGWFLESEQPLITWWGHAIALREIGPAAALAGTDGSTSSDAGIMLTAASHVFVPPAVVNVPDRHLFGGVDLSTFAYNQRTSPGRENHPALRGSMPAWSGLPGGQALEQLPDSRMYSVNLFVHSMNASGGMTEATEAEQARANLDALQAVLAARYEQPLVRVMPDGSGRQAQAKVWSVQEIDGRVANVLFALKVDFLLADPWFYTDTVVSGPTSLSSTSVTFNVTHPGSVRGHKALVEFLGPMTNPRLTNLTTGTFVQYTGAVGSSQRLVIDSEHFSATLAGVSVIGSVSHGGGVPFLWFDPGINVLQATSNPNGGDVTVTFAPPWI